jgi:hypothetical protein
MKNIYQKILKIVLKLSNINLKYSIFNLLYGIYLHLLSKLIIIRNINKRHVESYTRKIKKSQKLRLRYQLFIFKIIFLKS